MTLLAESGDRAAAMTEYVRLEDRLERELSIAPSRETRRLLAEIRAGASAAPVAAPLPPALAERGGALAGRADELERLLAATGAPPVGGAAVLLAGEPGIGKTRLLAEAGRAAHARGATVLYGRCYEEPVAPYEPFAEALGADTLKRLLNEADGERWRLFEAIGARLEGTVLLLDDLHWAEAGTLRLLAHVLRRPKPPRRAGRLSRHRDRPDPSARGRARRSAARGSGRAPPAARADRRRRAGDWAATEEHRGRDRREPVLRRAGAGRVAGRSPRASRT